MALRAIWQFMDRDVTHKIVYGPKRILWVTDWSINCHLAGSAVKYLLCYTQYMQICQTTCFCYRISKTKTGSDKSGRKHYIDRARSILYNYCTWTRSIWGFMKQSTTILNSTLPRSILLYSAPLNLILIKFKFSNCFIT